MKNYHAFISYRHADNKTPGRQWATWLHQALETYEIPDDLVGKINQRGEAIPSRIFPVFRDEEELPANADLANTIVKALDVSNILVVLCSPRAAASTYVTDEIDYFKSIGRSDKIIAGIIDGEPNTSWDESKGILGFNPSDECFPVPLQFAYDQQGKRSELRAEPIAADFRVNIEGKVYESWTTPEALKAFLKEKFKFDTKYISKKVAEYESQQQLMLLKIIAAIIAVPLGQLSKRDKAYQLQQAQNKARKLRQWLAAVASLAIISIGAGIFAYVKQQESIRNETFAVEQQSKAEKSLAEAYAGYGRRRLQEKNYEQAANYFTHAKTLNKSSVTALEEYSALANTLNKQWSETIGMRFDRQPYITNNGRFLVGVLSDWVLLYDLDKQQEIYRQRLLDVNQQLFSVSETGNYIFNVNSTTHELMRIDWREQIIDKLYVPQNKDAAINGTLLVLPNQQGDKLLHLSYQLAISIIDIPSKQVIASLSPQRIFEQDAQLVENFSTDGIQALVDWKFRYVDQHWILVTDNGLTIDIPELATQPDEIQVLAPLTNSVVVQHAISKDAKLIALLPAEYCLMNEQQGDWLRIAQRVEIWDLKSRQLLESKPLNWDEKFNQLLAHSACQQAYESEFSEDSELRQLAISINNQLNQLNDIYLSPSREIKLLWNNHLDSVENLQLQMVSRDQPEVYWEVIGEHNGAALIMQAAINSEKTGSNNDFENYWVYPVGNSQKLEFAKASTDIVSLISSSDQRFILSLASNGVFSAQFSQTGELLKQTQIIAHPLASILCPTELSHEVILITSNKIRRYNWLTENNIWELPIDAANTFPVSCDINLQSGELAVALLAEDNPWQDMKRQKQRDKFADETSKILLLSLTGELKQTIQNVGYPLAFPTKLKFDSELQQLAIATMPVGLVIYDYHTNSQLKNWILADRLANFTDFVKDPLSGEYYAGTSGGEVYQLSNEGLKLLTQLNNPVIALSKQADQLIIDTGFNETDFYQKTFRVLNQSSSSQSERVTYSLLDNTQELLKIYSEGMLKFLHWTPQLNQSIAYFLNGQLSKFTPSTISQTVFRSPDAKDKQLFYLGGNSYLEIQRASNGFKISNSLSQQSVVLETPLNRTLIPYLTEDKHWVVVTVFNGEVENEKYLFRIADLNQKIYLGSFYQDMNKALQLMDYNVQRQELVVCEQIDCQLIQLQALKDMDVNPVHSDQLIKRFSLNQGTSKLKLTDEFIFSLSVQGKLQKYALNRDKEIAVANEATTNQQKDTPLDDKSGFALVSELDDYILKNFFVDLQQQQLTLFSQQLIFQSSFQFEILQQQSNFLQQETALLASSQGDWILSIKNKIEGLKVQATLWDRKRSIELASIPMDILAAMTLEQSLPADTSVKITAAKELVWTNNQGGIVFWPLANILEFTAHWMELEDKAKINTIEQLTELSLSGVDLLRRPTDEAHHTGISFNSNQLTLAQQSFYAKQFMSENNLWKHDVADVIDLAYWKMPIKTHYLEDSDDAAVREYQIENLQQRIIAHIQQMKSYAELAIELEKLQPENPYVKLYKVQSTITSQPYQSFLLAQDLLVNLSLKEKSENKSTGDLVLKTQIIQLAIQTAIANNSADLAYSLITQNPLVPVMPQLVGQLANDLMLLGNYQAAINLLNAEMQRMEQFNVSEPTHPSHANYQSLLNMLRMLSLLDETRASLNSMPRICLAAIAPNSQVNFSKWKLGDCLLIVDANSALNPTQMWQALNSALAAGEVNVGVWRDQQAQNIRVQGSLDGAFWVLVGYNGVQTLRVNVLKESSTLYSKGLRRGDYLVILGEQRLKTQAELLSLLTKQRDGANLWVIQPRPGLPLSEPDPLLLGRIGEHPLAYWPGELRAFQIEASEIGDLSTVLFNVMAPTEQ